MIRISKPIIQSILLALWLFVLTAQPIITLLDIDSKVIVTSLTEEEHQEHPQGKKNTEAEKIFFNQFINLSQISNQQSKKIDVFYFAGISIHTQEIQVPPPERLV